MTVEEEISADNLVKVTLESAEGWDTIKRYVNEVLKANEVEERRREQEIATNLQFS